MSMLDLFREVISGNIKDYKIKDPLKLEEVAASIGIEASLTGHLVFSTLHTNSAPETITRLLDMGLNPLNFSDAFLGVMAQRLVRTICPECREPFKPGPATLEEFGLPQDQMFYQGKGCRACMDSGYAGRTGSTLF